MKIIFDLDYTLLDTSRFKTALSDAFTSCGITPERYEETYRATLNRDGKVSDYDPEAHLAALKSDFPFPEDAEKVSGKIKDLLLHTEEYLLSGAVELLRALRRDGNELILLTLGNEKWQRAKIDHSGLSTLFDEMVATERGKHVLLRGIIPEGDKAIIVNDNAEEMSELMNEAPGCTYILMKGPKSSKEGLELPKITSIKELGLYLERTGVLKEPVQENLPHGFSK